MKAIYTLLIILIPFLGFGQIINFFDLSDDQYQSAKSIYQSLDGGYILSGIVDGSGSQGFVLKTNENGELEWINYYEKDIHSLYPTSDLGYVFAYRENISTIKVVKLDQNGDEVWSNNHSHIFDIDPYNGNYYLKDIKQTNDDGYILLSQVTNYSGIFSDGLTGDIGILQKLNENGQEEWVKYFSGSLYTYNSPEDLLIQNLPLGGFIELVNDGGFIITVNLNNGSIIVKFNANGEYEYEKGYSTILFNDCSYNEWQGITSAKQTLDNGYILSGGCQYDPILIKTDSNGQLEWTKSIDNNSIESIATNIYQTNDEGYVFISRHGLRSTITKFDSVGNILGNLKLWNSANDGDNGIYEIYGVELLALTMNLTNDGGYVIGGKTINTNGENIEPSVFLMKIDNSMFLAPEVSTSYTDCDSIVDPITENIFYESGIYIDTIINDIGLNQIYTQDITVNSSPENQPIIGVNNPDPFSIHSYSCDVNHNNSNYSIYWEIVNGNIISDNGNYIEVQWGNDGFGQIICRERRNSTGCETINILNLSVGEYVQCTTSITQSGDILTAVTEPVELAIGANWYNIQTSNDTTRYWLMAENTSTFTPTFDCSYFIIASNENCSDTSSVYYYAEEARNIGQLSTSPNPTSGNVKVNFDNNNNQFVRLYLISNSGNILDEFLTKNNELEIDLSSYPSGTYHISFNSPKSKGCLNEDTFQKVSNTIILNK